MSITEQVSRNVEPHRVRVISSCEQLDEVALESDVPSVSSSRDEDDRRLLSVCEGRRNVNHGSQSSFIEAVWSVPACFGRVDALTWRSGVSGGWIR